MTRPRTSSPHARRASDSGGGRAAHRAASDEGSSPTEARLLRTLGDAVPQGRLAGLLGCDPARVSTLTAELERRGLVERVARPATGGTGSPG